MEIKRQEIEEKERKRKEILDKQYIEKREKAIMQQIEREQKIQEVNTLFRQSP